jgi:hypothetical protein
MRTPYSLQVPRTLEEACDPRRMALLVYDMQAGIVSQLPRGTEITRRVGEVLSAAREGGFPVFFSRHMSLPKALMGVFQLRQAMTWQRVERVEEVRSVFPRAADPDRARALPSTKRGGLRQDRHERLRGDLPRYGDARLGPELLRYLRHSNRGGHRADGTPRSGPRLHTGGC